MDRSESREDIYEVKVRLPFWENQILMGESMKIILFTIAVLFALCVNAAAQNKVGMVIGITGTARLKDISGKEQKLNERNFAISLNAGQSLRADGRGKVHVKLCNGRNETIGNKWFRVNRVICSGTAGPEKRRVLENTFDFGGRYKPNRGSDDFILFPFEEGITIVRPETIVFRWKSISETSLNLSLNIVGEEKPIWSKDVDGRTMSFISDELVGLFKDLRKRQPNVKLRVTLRSRSFGTENSSDFQIISLQDEDALTAELDQISNEKDVFRHIARAKIYNSYKLYNDVANEYEQALKLSPESSELSTATASAQDRIGNFARRDEIESRTVRTKR